MLRQSRIDSPGALHHIMVRGIERRKIFRDNEDKDNCDFPKYYHTHCRINDHTILGNFGCFAEFFRSSGEGVNDRPNRATHDRSNRAIFR